MITRNKTVNRTSTAKNKNPYVLLERDNSFLVTKIVKVNDTQKIKENVPPKKVNFSKSVKSKTQANRVSDLKQCYVKLMRLNQNAQIRSDSLKHTNRNEQVTLNKNGSKTSKLKSQNKRPLQHKNIQADFFSTPVINLRTRKPVKYAESSLEIFKSEDIQSKKVPIYNQFVNNDLLSKRKGDQYEFDSDSEKRKKTKRQKLEDSDSYSLTIQHVLKNISKHAKQRKHKIVYSEQKRVNRNVEMSALNTDDNKCDNEYYHSATLQKTPASKVKILSDVQLKSEHKFNLTVATPELFKHGKLNTNDSHVPSQDELNLDTSVKLFQNSRPKNSECHTNFKDESDLTMESPSSFQDGKPNANSTMLHHNKLTPWRFNNVYITRNPHFITLKQTALPCINQEMVLDHSLVDKLDETSKTGKNVTEQPQQTKDNKKLRLQATLNDYFNNTNENKENENYTQLSLFDNDQFSPIKTRNRIANNTGFAKRKILVETIENIQNTHSANNSRQEHVVHVEDKRDMNLTYFGFNSDDEDDVEEEIPKPKNNRPFRVSTNANDKKYWPKKKVKRQRIELMIVSDDEENYSTGNSDTESEDGKVGLFEDFCNTKSLLEQQEENIGMKKKSKKQTTSHRQKKQKDVRTKEEEEEAEKWAEAFNSMCEEIEQFPLEVE